MPTGMFDLGPGSDLLECDLVACVHALLNIDEQPLRLDVFLPVRARAAILLPPDPRSLRVDTSIYMHLCFGWAVLVRNRRRRELPNCMAL